MTARHRQRRATNKRDDNDDDDVDGDNINNSKRNANNEATIRTLTCALSCGCLAVARPQNEGGR